MEKILKILGFLLEPRMLNLHEVKPGQYLSQMKYQNFMTWSYRNQFLNGLTDVWHDQIESIQFWFDMVKSFWKFGMFDMRLTNQNNVISSLTWFDLISQWFLYIWYVLIMSNLCHFGIDMIWSNQWLFFHRLIQYDYIKPISFMDWYD